MNDRRKTISYRGGLVTFRIPDTWKEEYGADGGGAFYEDEVDSSTFRLEVMTIEAPPRVVLDNARDVLAAVRRVTPGDIELLPSGYALLRYTQQTMDRGHPLHIFYWIVAQVLPPTHARIATFSHTLLDLQQHVPRFQQERAMLEEEVRACVFWPELGK